MSEDISDKSPEAEKRFHEGVRDGVFLWLQDHPLSLGEAFIDAVAEGVLAWLDEHKDEIIEAIAEHKSRGE